MNVKVTNTSFQASPSSGDVSAILMMPLEAPCLLVFAHGAGRGMQHPFTEAMAKQLSDLQGTRDSFADLKLLRPVCKKHGKQATLHLVDGADHSFRLPKSSGRKDSDVLDELAKTVVEWVRILMNDVLC